MRLRRVVECRFRTAGRKGALSRQSTLHPKAEPAPVPLRGSLRCSQSPAAAELGLCPQTVLAETPRFAALLGTYQGRGVLIIVTVKSSIHKT